MDNKLIALTIAALTVFAVIVVAPVVASPPWAEDDEWSCTGDCIGHQDADGDGIPNCEDPDYEPQGNAHMWRRGQGSNSGKGNRRGRSGQKGYNGNCPNN